jgi:hypothetical protein
MNALGSAKDRLDRIEALELRCKRLEHSIEQLANDDELLDIHQHALARAIELTTGHAVPSMHLYQSHRASEGTDPCTPISDQPKSTGTPCPPDRHTDSA